jgi:hypothetical protein
MAPRSSQRAIVDGGRSVVSAVITSDAVNNAAGTLTAGATLRATAIVSPPRAMTSIAQTKTIPALRWTVAPLAA